MKSPDGAYFCDECMAEFTPASGAQKFCPSCGEARKAQNYKVRPVVDDTITCEVGAAIARLYLRHIGIPTAYHLGKVKRARVMMLEHRRECEQCRDLGTLTPARGNWHSREHDTRCRLEGKGLLEAA